MSEDRSWVMKHKYFGGGAEKPKPQRPVPPTEVEPVKTEKPVTSSIAAAVLNANGTQKKLAYKLTGATIKIIHFNSSTVSFFDDDTNEKFEIPLGDWWRELKKMSDGLP